MGNPACPVWVAFQLLEWSQWLRIWFWNRLSSCGPVPVRDAGGRQDQSSEREELQSRKCVRHAKTVEAVSLCGSSVPGSPFQLPSGHLHLDVPRCLKLLIISHLTMTLQYLYFNLTCLSKVTKSRELLNLGIFAQGIFWLK